MDSIIQTESQQNAADILTGMFAGPVAGVKYQTPTLSGLTNARGEFHYRAGEAVSFLIGRLVLGTAKGAARVNLAQLVNRVAGNIDRLHDPAITNLARLVYALDQDGNLETGITIAPAVHDIMGARVIAFDNLPGFHEEHPAGYDRFENEPVITDLFATLNATPGVFTAGHPRKLLPGAAARNQLRRDIRGIIKMTDVQIPTRNGAFVSADIFRPADAGHYPAILNMSFYGKSFYHDCICNDADATAKEDLEDRYFSGNPEGQQYENHESVNSADWVPHGYCTIRIDSRGVGKSAGQQAPLSRGEAEDYYDAIEWAAAQPWSNGSIGLWGMSYVAMTQHNVASLQPPHLQAMIALGTDSDPYNEYLASGGLWSESWWTWWWKIWSGKNHCGERRETDWMARLRATPFNDPAAYNTHSASFMRPDMTQATAPVWIVGPQSGAVIHQLGSAETFRRATAAKARKFDFIDAWFPHSYHPSTIAEHRRFFDYWLKGEDNGAMEGPSVRVQVRSGNGAFFEIHDDTWPLPATRYEKLYLDATPSAAQDSKTGRNFLRLSHQKPQVEAQAGYAAELELGKPIPFPKGHVGGTPRWSTGISFLSEPMAEDMILAGYMKIALWVSSSSHDMDVHASLRVIDEHGDEIRYEASVMPADPEHIHPIFYGCLKVSHRKLDASRSTEFWPVHTHLAEDYAPLSADEIVPVAFGLNPSTAFIRKNCCLRLDLQPNVPAGLSARIYDDNYHRAATNKIFTGPERPSYVQLPLIPVTPQG